MRDDTRAAIADLAVACIATIALAYVIKTPSLRRATGRLLKYALFTAAPSFLWHETARAWAESAHN